MTCDADQPLGGAAEAQATVGSALGEGVPAETEQADRAWAEVSSVRAMSSAVWSP
jgi:hypothetical protein